MARVFAHGLYGYNYFGCRCQVCRGAIRDWKRKYRAEARAKAAEKAA
jgi:hypothetical protein